MHIAVVGAGIMGSSTALALAARGATVTLLERAVPGAEASSAAAGILGAQLEMHEKKTLLETFARARKGYAAWADELEQATGIDVGYRVTGALVTGPREELAEAARWQTASGLRAELVDGAALREIEPELSSEITCAVHYPDESQVDPPSLLRALVAALGRARVTMRSGVTVERLVVENDRCVGVRLEDGDLRADAVVLAAGSWSSLVPGADVKVRPARGQMVLLEERPPRLRTIVVDGHSYAVPRGDGRVLCGSTVEFVGYKREVTAAGVNAILGSVLRAVPTLGGATLASTWSSFRPHTEGEKSLVGASSLPGLFLATGHFRNGILLAKVTADEVADAILT
jgi:glycine oxidase